MKKLTIFSTIYLFLPLCIPAQVKPSSPKAARLPTTIEVKQDVKVTHDGGGQVRGRLYLGGGATKEFVLKKGQRLQMVAVGQEGGCRIRFQGKEYDLSSCPWLPGFRDHQEDVFSIITRK